MKPEDTPPVSESPQDMESSGGLSGREEVTKVADLQRMNMDQLNVVAREMGLKHLGSLAKSQMVFEIVKAKAEHPTDRKSVV